MAAQKNTPSTFFLRFYFLWVSIKFISVLIVSMSVLFYSTLVRFLAESRYHPLLPLFAIGPPVGPFKQLIFVGSILH